MGVYFVLDVTNVEGGVGGGVTPEGEKPLTRPSWIMFHIWISPNTKCAA